MHALSRLRTKLQKLNEASCSNNFHRFGRDGSGGGGMPSCCSVKTPKDLVVWHLVYMACEAGAPHRRSRSLPFLLPGACLSHYSRATK
jgi:hypothetical protein